MSQTHILKLQQPYFDHVLKGLKTFEIRNNDGRNFKVGDIAELHEYDKESDTYSGNILKVEILYTLSHFYGLFPHYIIFSFRVIEFVSK